MCDSCRSDPRLDRASRSVRHERTHTGGLPKWEQGSEARENSQVPGSGPACHGATAWKFDEPSMASWRRCSGKAAIEAEKFSLSERRVRIVILRYCERSERCPIINLKFLKYVMKMNLDSAVGKTQSTSNFLV